MINTICLGVSGIYSKNDSPVAVDISGLWERFQGRNETTTLARDDKEEDLSKRSYVSATQQGTVVTYTLSSQGKGSQGDWSRGQQNKGGLRGLWKEDSQPELGGGCP